MACLLINFALADNNLYCIILIVLSLLLNISVMGVSKLSCNESKAITIAMLF